jgi:CHASE2 domain-containing sensor protein
MGRSNQLGTLLMIGAAVSSLIMVIGAMRRSYLVIAIPVLAATGLISALAFWVGWTMANTEPDLAELEERETVPAAV